MLRIAYLHSFFLILVLISSCSSKKTTASDVIGLEEPKDDSAKMKDLGYTKAIVKDFSKNEGCGFLIELVETQQILQPLKPLELDFQKNNLGIWIKYRPIRPIAPKCKNGQTVDVEEIKKG